MLNETVNPSTGAWNHTQHIGIPVAPGRKLTVPLAFEYNSGQAWFFARKSTYQHRALKAKEIVRIPRGMQSTVQRSATLTWGGWSTSFPEMSHIYYAQWPYGPNGFGITHPCVVHTAFMFKDASGSSHQLNLSHLDPSYPAACSGTVPQLVEADTANDTYYQSVT